MAVVGVTGERSCVISDRSGYQLSIFLKPNQDLRFADRTAVGSLLFRELTGKNGHQWP
jgi:hypothetical protein